MDVHYVYMDAIIDLPSELIFLVWGLFRLVDIIFNVTILIYVFAEVEHKVIILLVIPLEVVLVLESFEVHSASKRVVKERVITMHVVQDYLLSLLSFVVVLFEVLVFLLRFSSCEVLYDVGQIYLVVYDAHVSQEIVPL